MMAYSKSEIISRLQGEVLAIQGLKPPSHNNAINSKLSPFLKAFPNSCFPVAAVHEFISIDAEDTAATGGFVSVLLASLMQNQGAALWISACRNIYPPALKSFGIAPDKIIFIDLDNEKEILWTMEEALKCKGLRAVICELQELSFTASRRLQLAVEKSQVTGFVLRQNPRSINTTACVTRWKISALLTKPIHGMPGVGFPRWNVQLLKVRNGRPDSWQVEFAAGFLRHLSLIPAILPEQKKKAG